MPPLQRAELTLEADPDNDGNQETGKFVMAGNLSISPSIRTGFIVGGRGSSVHSVLSELIDDGTLSDANKRRGFYWDLGGGQHSIQIEFRGWEGAQLEDGTPVQWGDDPNVGRSQTSATGQDPITQIDVLMRYLTTGEFDSFTPATLEYGEYSSGGLYDSLDVVIEGPRATRTAQNDDTYDGTITCITAASVQEYIDAAKKRET